MDILNANYMLGTIPNALRELTYLMLTTVL
jgi:hypothetical protein